MTTRTALILLTLLATSSFGQTRDTLSNHEIRITDTTIEPNSYYVIKADNRQLEFFADSLEFNSNPLRTLEPKWIKAINIYKGQKAIDKFGDKGLNGVIIIELKKGRLKKLPDDIQKEFVTVDTKI